ncbi:hypothetical protein HHK36_027453 [Tetracentron sinense]|uniref:Myb-like domain-containing protein n=1 Tax=Tetracentron sinense TaxID=13715 RepID=A0A834YGQ8_TETSI|nr:hypothetical protein HHK36_027453 [Tetracentron sinense]
MGRAPCCSKVGLHRGPWTIREDTLLTKYIQAHGEGHWRSLPKKAGQGTDKNSHKRMFKLSREPKKRNNNNNKSKNKKINKVKINGETIETRIHLPKAFRLTSVSIKRNNSFDSNTVSGSSSHDGDKGICTGVIDFPWSDLKNTGHDSGGVIVCDEDDDLINGCDLAYRSPIPTKDIMLEKLYEEYLQLLEAEDQAQFDSLAGSLFV